MTAAEVSFDRLHAALKNMAHFGRNGEGEEIALGGDEHNALTSEIAAALIEMLESAGLNATILTESVSSVYAEITAVDSEGWETTFKVRASDHSNTSNTHDRPAANFCLTSTGIGWWKSELADLIAAVEAAS